MSQNPRSIEVAQIATLPSISGAKVSWDGTQIAYYSNHTGRWELYIRRIGETSDRLVGEGSQPESPRLAPIWSRDDRTIIFVKDNDGDENHQVYALDLAEDSIRIIVGGEGQHLPVEVSPDNLWLTLTIVSSGKQRNLYLAPMDASSELIQLTSYDKPVFGGTWHPSGEWILFFTNTEDNLDNLDTYRIRPDGKGCERFFRRSIGSIDAYDHFTRDGRLLSVGSNHGGTWRPGVMDWDTAAVHWFGNGDADESTMAIDPNGQWLVTYVTKDAAKEAKHIDLITGKSRPLSLAPGVLGNCEVVLDDATLVMTHQDPEHRRRLLLYRLEDDSQTEIISACYGDLDRELLSPSRHVYYKSSDDMMIGAVLTEPKGTTSESDKQPAIVLVHGGPTGHSSLCFDPLAQLFASRGFHVLRPNYRGSTGYGNAYEEANRGDLGGMDAEDLKAGAKFLADLGAVDPKRIAIGGGSYGGYLTYRAMTCQNETWAAGVAFIGITDWIRLYESSPANFKTQIEKLFGHPTRDEALMKERSPINHAQELRAPLLMIQGQNDPRCPVEQSRIFRDRLIELGRIEGDDFEYVELDKQGHGSSAIPAQTELWSLWLDFIERKLGTSRAERE